MTTTEVLFMEWLYGLFVTWPAIYLAERFESLIVKILVIAVVISPLVLLVEASGIIPDDRGVVRIIVYFLGIWLGARAGEYTYKLRNPSMKAIQEES